MSCVALEWRPNNEKGECCVFCAEMIVVDGRRSTVDIVRYSNVDAIIVNGRRKDFERHKERVCAPVESWIFPKPNTTVSACRRGFS